MKAAVYHGRATDICVHTHAFADGLRRHGVTVDFYTATPAKADFAVVWGWRKGLAVKRAFPDMPVCVLERGYIGDRFYWTSIGWNGLNGRAEWNDAADNGERFANRYGGFVKEWRNKPNGYVLLIGQVEGDAALYGVNINQWYEKTNATLIKAGHDVIFRAHPVAIGRGHSSLFPSMNGPLEAAFTGAKAVVTFNSNTGVEAVLNGIPTYAADIGAMAYDVTSHDLSALDYMPDRSEWFRQMAWRQWSIDEITNGEAWAHVRQVSKTTRHKIGLVIGGANSAFKDAKRAFELAGSFDYVVGCNDVIADYPGHLDIAISLHPKKLPKFLELRAARGYPKPGIVISYKHSAGVERVLDYRWPEMKYSGSTGHYGAKVLIDAYRCSKIILAGVPMDKRNAHYNNAAEWADCNLFLPAWEQTEFRLRGKVKSFDGFTANLLGRPTKDWLDD